MHYLIWFVTPITDQQLNFHHKMPRWNKNPCSLSHEAGTYVQSIFQGLFQVHMPQRGKNAWTCCVFLTRIVGRVTLQCVGSDLWEVKCCEDGTIQIPTWSQLATFFTRPFLPHDFLRKLFHCSEIWCRKLTWTNNQQIVSNCNLYLFSQKGIFSFLQLFDDSAPDLDNFRKWQRGPP